MVIAHVREHRKLETRSLVTKPNLRQKVKQKNVILMK